MAKKLLNEATVRRFAKLANISAINENMYEQEEEELDLGAEEMPAEEPPAELDAEMPEEEPVDDMAGAEDLELTDDEAQAIIDLGKKLEAAMPEEAPLEEPLEEPMDAEVPAEEPMGAEVPEEEEELLEALKGINYVPEKKEIVEEVARRVAKRLLKAKRAQAELSEALGKEPKRTRQSRRAKK